jgi:hypothetical protein
MGNAFSQVFKADDPVAFHRSSKLKGVLGNGVGVGVGVGAAVATEEGVGVGDGITDGIGEADAVGAE